MLGMPGSGVPVVGDAEEGHLRIEQVEVAQARNPEEGPWRGIDQPCGGIHTRSVANHRVTREPRVRVEVPSDELFRFHTAQVGELGGYLLGRRLYETMQVWETDPSLRDNEPGAAFADVWSRDPAAAAAISRTRR